MSDGPLSPEEVTHRGFGTTFRGFDTGEVRAYLQRVANDLREATGRERDLHRRLADAEYRAAHPVLEGDALTRALGDEMGRILASAQEAANGLRDKAEENAARILRDAHEQAQRIRAQAEAILAARTAEADGEAAEIRRAATEEGADVVERARREAAAAMADVEGKARQLVYDAQAARARVLGDLTRRRRLLQTQVEQLRAGRERLLEAYRKVRSTTDEVADELQRVEDEARKAAGAAGERVAAEPQTDDLHEVLAAFPTDPAAIRGSGGGNAASVPAGDAPEGVPEPVGSAEAPGAAVAAVAAEVRFEIAAQRAGQAAEAAESMAAEAAAVEAAAVEAASDAEPPPQVVSTRPGGPSDRRPLRLLRRPKGDGRPLDVVAASSDEEAVRVIAPAPAPMPEPEIATAPDTGPEVAEASAPPPIGVPTSSVEAEQVLPADEPAGASDAGGPSGHAALQERPTPTIEADLGAAGVSGVDELFARIRAGRADAVARAHEVLASDPGAPIQLPDTPTDTGPPDEPAARSAEPAAEPTAEPADDEPPARPTDEPAARPTDEPAAPPADEPAAPPAEELLLRRRDSAVDGIEPKLSRKLKRALQDEQNEVLDRLRSAKAGAAPDAVLPSADEQAARYRLAADEMLRSSAAAGVAFVAPGEDARPEAPEVGDVVVDLAAALAVPLRRALERALTGDGADQGAVVERIGAAYRECKAQRIEGLAGDAVTAAFGRGTLAAMAAGEASRWVVDDDGRPCPDCDDNALAGATPAGEAFPTGQPHPPAHAGCRCLLAPAELSAAVSGAG